MFRKPKKLNKNANRRKQPRQEDSDDNDDEDDKIRQEELQKARKRAKTNKSGGDDNNDNGTKQPPTLMHQFESSSNGQNGPSRSHKDLVTSTNENHPTTTTRKHVNKFLAGPIKATTHIRTTCRFDYQPDICKDYKDTGFCGFGDTCIYLHDRGDTLSGWQLEQQWQQEQAEKQKKQNDAMEEFMNKNSNKGGADKATVVIPDDGIPFACFLCRQAFQDPQVTTCGHYFCQACIMKHVQEVAGTCPVCNKDTHNVFHEPTKLISKKRKVVGRDATWQEFIEACQKKSGDEEEE